MRNNEADGREKYRKRQGRRGGTAVSQVAAAGHPLAHCLDAAFAAHHCVPWNFTRWRTIHRLHSSWYFCGFSAGVVIAWTDSPLWHLRMKSRTAVAGVWKLNLELASYRKKLDTDFVGDERSWQCSHREVAAMAGSQANRFRVFFFPTLNPLKIYMGGCGEQQKCHLHVLKISFRNKIVKANSKEGI